MRRVARLWFPLACALVLSLPMLANVLLPAPHDLSELEKHSVAAMPQLPHRVKDMGRWPRSVDAFANDHFGLRNQFIAANAVVFPPALRTTNRHTLRGDADWLFLLDESMIEQSKGELLRLDDVERTAVVVAHVATVLKGRGVRFIFAAPPNSATVYPDHLPTWARNPGVETEYDALLARLATQGVSTVDLRTVLRTARAATSEDLYYHQDTHWSPSGALAAFNAIATRTGHADWPFDASASLGPAEWRSHGDLVRMSGDTRMRPERVRPMRLVSPGIDAAEAQNPFSSYQTRDPKPVGTRLLIIGDSFTQYPFLALDSGRAAQVAWTYYNRCAFDWTIVDRFKPDEVWLLPTERQMLCSPGAAPMGMP